MAAEITIFRQVARHAQSMSALQFPLESHTATFTATNRGIARVWANGGAVVLTLNSITWTVPSGTVEYFGIEASDAVTVA